MIVWSSTPPPFPSSSGGWGEGHPRFSIWTLNLVFQIVICFQAFYSFFFFLILPDIATRSYSNLRWYCTYNKKWSEASVDDWEGADWSRCLLLFVSLTVACDQALLAGKREGRGGWSHGLVYWSQKAMQILPFTKWHSAYSVQMGNLQTNSSWSWMRHWQSLNARQTIRGRLQLTTPANEFPQVRVERQPGVRWQKQSHYFFSTLMLPRSND